MAQQKLDVHFEFKDHSDKFDYPHYIIKYGGRNPYSNKTLYYTIIFKVPGQLKEDIIDYLKERIFFSKKYKSFFDTSKFGQDRVKAGQLKTEMNAVFRKLIKSAELPNIAHHHKQEEMTSETFVPDDFKLLERKADDSGKSIGMLGRSFSGKTYKTVEELNKILQLKRGGDDPLVAHRPMFERIFVLTTSPHAQPWRNLNDPWGEEGIVRIIPGYLPKLISLLKRISDASDNAVPWLLVLDDCFANMKQGSFKSLVLTLRNANISTMILTQAYKHASPDCRASFHNILITGMNAAEWEQVIGAQLLKHVITMLEENGVTVPAGRGARDRIARLWEEFVKSNIVFYNQREDKLFLIKREPFN